MLYFDIKTHKCDRTYTKPHFFILNKGLNSGKPLTKPCPNCFVITATNDEDKNTLFHISMMLQISGFYAVNLKGSVIPFISINDCRNTLKKGLNTTQNVDKHAKIIALMNKKEEELKQVISKIESLKMSYIKACFKEV